MRILSLTLLAASLALAAPAFADDAMSTDGAMKKHDSMMKHDSN